MEHLIETAFSNEITVENAVFGIMVSPQQGVTVEETPHILHSHSFCEVFVCLDGHLRIDTDGESFDVGAGGVLVAPSAVKHCLNADAVGEHRCINFFCQKRGGGTTDLYGVIRPLITAKTVLTFPNAAPLSREVTLAVKTMRGKYSASLAAVGFLVALGEAYSAAAQPFGNFSVDRSYRLDAIINSRYAEPLTLKDIAAEFYLSERHLSRIIEKTYGMPFHRLLNEKRLAAAGNMLKNTKLPVHVIAETCGFSSVPSFYRLFSARNGTTPTDYRKQEA